jgi:hypothetical protein
MLHASRESLPAPHDKPSLTGFQPEHSSSPSFPLSTAPHGAHITYCHLLNGHTRLRLMPLGHYSDLPFEARSCHLPSSQRLVTPSASSRSCYDKPSLSTYRRRCTLPPTDCACAPSHPVPRCCRVHPMPEPLLRQVLAAAQLCVALTQTPLQRAPSLDLVHLAPPHLHLR